MSQWVLKTTTQHEHEATKQHNECKAIVATWWTLINNNTMNIRKQQEHDGCLARTTWWMLSMNNTTLDNSKNTINTKYEQWCDDHETTTT